MFQERLILCPLYPLSLSRQLPSSEGSARNMVRIFHFQSFLLLSCLVFSLCPESEVSQRKDYFDFILFLFLFAWFYDSREGWFRVLRQQKPVIRQEIPAKTSFLQAKTAQIKKTAAFWQSMELMLSTEKYFSRKNWVKKTDLSFPETRKRPTYRVILIQK